MNTFVRRISAFILFVSFVTAASVNYPLQDQIPQIAVVNQRYLWTFSRDTFSLDQAAHDSSSLLYAAPDLPSWLTFDPSTRSFSGEPGMEDIGTITVKVFASEYDDSQSIDSFRLVVAAAPPSLSVPIAEQFIPTNPHISSATIIPVGENGALIPGVKVPQKWSFSIGLEYETITSPFGRPIFYSAALVDRSPLPRWLIFDPDIMTFEGVTPTIKEGDRSRFEVVLFGSEKEGYAGAEDHFSFTIEGQDTHQLVVTSPLTPVNVSADSPFSFDFDFFDFHGVQLNGADILRQNISEILVDTSNHPWLFYDKDTSRLSGYPHRDLMSQPPPVLPLDIIAKVDNLTVSANVTINILPSAFTTTSIPLVFAPPSSRVWLDIGQFLSNETIGGNVRMLNMSASYNPREASSWLSFDGDRHTLSGIVPNDVGYSSSNITFHATYVDEQATSYASLILNLSSVPTSDNTLRRKGGLSDHNKLVVGATLGVVGGVVLLCCLLAGCRVWCSDKEPPGVYVIDHGPHGDRAAAGVWKLSEETVRGLSMEKEKDLDAYSSGYGGSHIARASTAVETSRSPSPFLSSIGLKVPPLVHISNARTTKGNFFKKLKVISSKSLKSLGRRSQKENHPPSGSSNALGDLSNKSKPLISKPMPMPLGSAHSALKIGMRTGTSPSNSMDQFPIVESGRVLVDPSTKFSAQTVPTSSMASQPTKLVSASQSNRSIGGRESPSDADKSQTLEGGVDREPWATEPSYVWASGKVVKTPALKQGSAGNNSLDSLVPKRRKDFGPVGNSGDGKRGIVVESTVVEPSSSSTSLSQPLDSDADHRASAISTNSAYGGINTDPSDDAIISMANRQHVMGVATPKRSVHSLHSTSANSCHDLSTQISVSTSKQSEESGSGFETEVGGSNEVREGEKPRLVNFSHERKAGNMLKGNGQRSVSHKAVITSGSGSVSKRTGGSSSMAQTALMEEPETDLDEKLGLGLDYVRAFGMDGDNAEKSPLFFNSPPLPSKIAGPSVQDPTTTLPSSESSASEASGHSGRARSLYTVTTSHRSAHVSKAVANGTSPSVASVASNSPASIYTSHTQPTQPKSRGGENLGQENTSPLRLRSNIANQLRTSTHRILVGAGQPFNFSAPLSSPLEGFRSNQDLRAELENGDRLPDWLRFDEREMEFWGVPPAKAEGNFGVCVWQNERCVAVFVVEIVTR